MQIDTFGKKLEIFMAVNDINQYELAEKLGTDPGYISRVINEKITPRENTKEEITAALGFTLDEFENLSYVCIQKGSMPRQEAIDGFRKWCNTKGYIPEKYFDLAYWITENLTPTSLACAMDAMCSSQPVELSLTLKILSNPK